MNIQKMTYAVATLVVIVILIAVVIVPVVQVSQKEFETVEQNTSGRYVLSSSMDDVTFTYSNGAPYVNGESMDSLTTGLTEQTRFYVVSDIAMLFCTWTPATSSWSTSLVVIGPVFGDERMAITLLSTSDYATFENGTLTVYRAGSPASEYTGQYSYLLVPSSTGNYGSYAASDLSDIHVNFDKDIYVIGNTSLQNGFVAKGTLENLNFEFNYYNQTAVVDGTITANYTEDDYGLSATLTGATVSAGTVSAGYFFVPIEYNTIDSKDGVNYVLLGIIPILSFVIPIIFLARLITTRD